MKKIILGLVMLSSFVGASTNEISQNVQLTVNKDALRLMESPDVKIIQMAGTRYHSYVTVASNAITPFAKGSVGNLGVFFVQNLSTNNPVYLSVTSTNGAITTNMMLKAREFGTLRFFPGFSITNFNSSTTGGVADCKITIIED